MRIKREPMPRRPTFLREWREYKHLTMEQAAERIEIDRTTLGRIESCKLPYNQDFLERASLAYGVEVIDLLFTDPTKPAPPRLVFDRLKSAPESVQQAAAELVEVLLKRAS